MQAPTIKPSTADTKAILSLTKASKLRKSIAKLDERQLKLDAAKEKVVKELADADRFEAIEAGQTEFVKAVETLDLTTREVVISTVLESFKDDSRRAQIQAWVAAISELKTHPDPVHQQDKIEAGPGMNPTPAIIQTEISSAKSGSSVPDSALIK